MFIFVLFMFQLMMILLVGVVNGEHACMMDYRQYVDYYNKSYSEEGEKNYQRNM